MHSKLKISSIAGVRGDIHEFYALIEQNLNEYSQDLDNFEPIDACRIYIHQLNGLFEMLELKPINIVNNQIEHHLTALIDGHIQPDTATVDILKEAVINTLDYLDDLMDGAPENLLRLYPVYRTLMQSLGREQISVFDLFHPALTATPTLKPVLPESATQPVKVRMKHARTEYQFGLAQWLKNTTVKVGLDKMRNAIAQIEQLPGSSEQRTFWWIAGGFLDSLLEKSSEIDLSSRKLCGQLEKTIRHSVEDTLPDTTQLVRTLLFEIARTPASEAENRQVDAIRTAFALPHLNQSESELIDNATAVVPRDYLKEIQKQLVKINDDWQAFCSGEHAALDIFTNAIMQLNEPAAQIQCLPMQQLITAIRDAARALQAERDNSNVIRDDVIMEVATALLHLESIILNFNKRQDDLPALVDTICTRLSTVCAPDDTHPETQRAQLPPTSNDFQDPAKIKEIQIQAATEMLADLQQIEKTLELFFQTVSTGEPGSTEAISILTARFDQISGMFVMLGLENAELLLQRCHSLVKKLAQPDSAVSQSEQNLLVDGVSSLGFFLEAFKHDPVDSLKIIDQAIAVFDSTLNQKQPEIVSVLQNLGLIDTEDDTAEQKTAETEHADTQESIPAARIDRGVDTELLEIFLEESDEILADIDTVLQRCRNDIADVKSLTDIRRSFHTLKGSSRMVQLDFFSDAAWTVEQMLNNWLNEKNQITAALIDVLHTAHQNFTYWCGNLKTTGQSEIDIQDLQARIDALNSGDDTAHAIGSQSADVPDADAKAASVSIGDIVIETELFTIFSAESKQHFATLEQELEALLMTHPATISKTFMLASHTLASTAGALALNFIAELSAALETWSLRRLENQMPLDDVDTQLIQNCVQHLGELLQKVYLQQFPEEVDLQLVQFLCSEITKRQNETPSVEKTAHPPRPIDLREYRLKKVPAFIQTAPSETEQEQTNKTADEPIDQISADLLHVFLEEARDTMPKISEKIRAWRILPQNDEIRITLLRLLHTLKGSANMIDVEQLGELIHTMESEIEEAFSEPVVPGYAIDKIEYEFDQLCEKIEWLQSKVFKTDLPDTEPHTDSASGETTELVAAETQSTATSDLTESETIDAALEPVVQPIAALRVNAELVDRLVNDAGEISIIRAKIESQLNNFKQSLQDLNESVDRLHGQIREIEIQAETQLQSHLALQNDHDQSFDPLELDRFTRFQELTRLMAESVDDVITVQKNLTITHCSAVEAVSQQTVINRHLQQELVRIRTIPFSSISERYYRIARKTAAELDKKVNLTIDGEDVEIDRSVLEKIGTSLEHLLRNAIVHGIEKAACRHRTGKTEIGQISINLHREGNEVLIRVSDDGNGLDLNSIYKKAIKLGLINKNETLDDDEIAELIFLPGLTTHTQLTESAGRGMGMDIVHNDITGLGGHISIESHKNQGSQFHIRLPLTLAVAQTLMVSAGNQIFAIPSSIIAHIHEVDSNALETAYQTHQIDFEQRSYPFTHLSFLLNQTNLHFEEKKHNHVVLLQSGNAMLAVQIDQLIGNQEVAVKNTGAQIAHAPGIEGATLTGDGVPVLILNPLKLLHRADAQKTLSTPFSELVQQSAPLADTTAVVLIVDDSLTVRKATSRLLERKGYRVLIAKNGTEALEIIEKSRPDIILTDLEMPQMNGFEFIEMIRNNADTVRIPLIVISSRTADKHRQMAEQLGANVFIGKPYKEDALLEQIEHLLQTD